MSALAAVILGLAPGQGVLAATPPLVLSRAQALELGLGGSLSLRSQELTVEENQALVGLARSRFRPKLDLVALGTFAQVKTDVGFISNLPTIGDLNLNLGADSSALINNTFVNLGLILTMPLVDFGRGPLQQAAQADLQAARAAQAEQQRRSRFDILSRYLAAQLSAAQIPVWESSLSVSRRVLSDVNAIRRVGLAPRIDTFQAEALLQTDLQGLAEAQAQYDIALSALARVLNLPAETRVEAGDPLQPDPAWSPSLSDSINQALEQRPALESLIQLQQAQRARVQLARAGRLPSVGLLVGGGVSGNWLDIPNQSATPNISASNGSSVTLPSVSTSSSASGSFTDWGAAITVRQPLYDGGLTRESIALAQRRAAQTEITVQQAQQAIIQSVETWFATHRAAASQTRAARAAITAGERSVQDSLLRYRAGLSPLTELLIAQRNLQVARSAEASAIYRWNLSRAGLELETGLES
ncbi:TolC family protein [Cyanobium sp. BA5m-21]|uniref:TolC family protein n=1 Tax=unclassified Cyanobium TaxID=2627006 RepID=UPI0020CCBE47|nr:MULTISPECIES: TolC family protein [unclassified Cyanobium]MCP9904290.1 TolC family protein [Cyanobium sp. BA5m-10]MCP9907420.1 TolC family protein [Cyanobium sp. BA5m-21]MCP9914098.1 TolC family protein [Cyanobium sp. BA20m-14]